MKKKFWIKVKNRNISAVISEPKNNKKKVIVVCAHGHSSNKNSRTTKKLFKAFNKIGIAALAFDFYGHGESDGDFEDATITKGIEDLAAVVNYTKVHGYKHVGLFGSSFGGMCCVQVASKTSDISFLLLKSPALDYMSIFKYLNIDLDSWKKKGYAHFDNCEKEKYEFFKEAIKYDSYNAAKKIKIPTLIVHGAKDNIVPIEQSKKISKMLKNCQLVIIKNLTHNYNEKQLDLLTKLFCDFVTQTSKDI